MKFFPLSIEALDTFAAWGGGVGGGGPVMHYKAIVVGRDSEHRDTAVAFDIHPYFFITSPSAAGKSAQKIIQHHVARSDYNHVIEKECCVVKANSLFGAVWKAQHTLAKLTFPSLGDARKSMYIARKNDETTAEGVDLAPSWPLIRELHRLNLRVGEWYELHDAALTASSEKMTCCQREFAYKPIPPTQLPSFTLQPQLKLCSWDIEVFSANPKQFPTPEKKENVIICIAASLETFGGDQVRNVVLFNTQHSDIPTSPDEEFEIRCYASEEGAIVAFANLLRDECVDVSVAYNSYGFDWRYISTRIDVACNDPVAVRKMFGRVLADPEKGTLKTRSIRQDSPVPEEQWIHVPGVYDLDLILWLKKNVKLDSYALKSVAHTYLPETQGKIDLPPSQIFKLFVDHQPEGLLDIARYAVRDTVIPLQLMRRLRVLEDCMSIAHTTYLPLHLINRGQQLRCLSLILKYSMDNGYVLLDSDRPERRGEDEDEDDEEEAQKYVGATVLDPVRGVHHNVSCLDFASLYPSIMRAEKYCFSTLVRGHEKGIVPHTASLTTLDLPDDTTLTTLDPATVEESRTVIPRLLADLAAIRKKYKRNMADAEDESMKAVWNARQNSVKLVMNSVYGFLGVAGKYAKLPCIQLAMAITTQGRLLLIKTRDQALDMVPGSVCVYGDTDSVMIKFKTLNDTLQEHFDVAERVAAEISTHLPRPHCLEFEKLFGTMLLFTKKRYACLSHEPLADNTPGPGKHYYRGIQIIRRDTISFTKALMKEVIGAAFKKEPFESLLDLAASHVKRLLEGDVGLEDLASSKKLREEYANENVQPHFTAARREFERSGTSLVGERVFFVYVDRTFTEKSSKVAELTETLDYCLRSSLNPDIMLYYDRHVLKPLLMILELYDPENAKDKLESHPSVKTLLQNMVRVQSEKWSVNKRLRVNKENRQHEITSFFSIKKKKEESSR